MYNSRSCRFIWIISNIKFLFSSFLSRSVTLERPYSAVRAPILSVRFSCTGHALLRNSSFICCNHYHLLPSFKHSSLTLNVHVKDVLQKSTPSLLVCLYAGLPRACTETFMKPLLKSVVHTKAYWRVRPQRLFSERRIDVYPRKNSLSFSKFRCRWR